MKTEDRPINWKTTLFLLISPVVALVGVPWYISTWGLGLFDILHFLLMAYATGLGITVGYHRLVAHRSFDARPWVRKAAVLAATASLEHSAITWSSEHRYHHRFVDRDGMPYDPYNIRKGFFHAHIGWLIRKQPPLSRDNVKDLLKDPFLVWQDRHIHKLMIGLSLVLPTLVGLGIGSLLGYGLLQAALSGFLFGGVARIVFVHHGTFFINSLCHTLGRRPYDGESSARDSGFVAFLTYGEGYHNYHHAYPGDYRNGIRAWHFDPGKWVIWLLERTRQAWGLKRVPEATIRLALHRERLRRLERRDPEWITRLSAQAREKLQALEANLEELHQRSKVAWSEYRALRAKHISRRSEQARALRAELDQLRREILEKMSNWETLLRELKVQPA